MTRKYTGLRIGPQDKPQTFYLNAMHTELDKALSWISQARELNKDSELEHKLEIIEQAIENMSILHMGGIMGRKELWSIVDKKPIDLTGYEE